MKTVSWILLLLVGTLTLLGSMASGWIALSQAPDGLLGRGLTLSNVTVPPEVALAVRGRRVTAAAYAAGYALLFLAVVFFPYRRGEVWSWWAILVASLVLLVVIVLRVPMLGTQSAVGVALIQFGIVIVALLLDVGRLRGKTAG
jgi:hypothetical protein